MCDKQHNSAQFLSVIKLPRLFARDPEKIKNERKRKSKRSQILILIIVMIGWYTMLYPFSADRLNRIYNVNTITAYQDILDNYSDEDLEQILQKCIEYNETIAEQQKTQTFRYRGSSATDETYESLPIPGSSTVCSVYIPKLSINISVVHGTTDSELQSSAGHLYGTSLPIEGDNVHSVIAAHAGLPSARLFTNLDDLEEGDVFYITTLRKEYCYTVTETHVSLPEDEWQYEQIEDGKNLATLYTCTPYGINTHRLLVTGELTQVNEISDSRFNPITLFGQICLYACELALVILGPFLYVLASHVYDENKKTKRGKKGDEAHA